MWTNVDDFHIEKSRLPVVVSTTTGERLEGDLFVQHNVRRPSGLEDAPDVLNASEPFFPLGSRDRVLLVAKSQVRVLHVVNSPALVHPDIGTLVDVDIQVDSGQMVSGTIIAELASARSRVLDFLNRLTERFLPVYTDEGLVLVNRDLIVHVEQVP